MKFINMTAYPVIIFATGNTETPVAIFPPSGKIILDKTETVQIIPNSPTYVELYSSYIDEPIVKVCTVVDGEIDRTIPSTFEKGLPEIQPDTMLIVSRWIRAAFPNRFDLASPGKVARNSDGIAVGCFGLFVNKQKEEIKNES